MALLFNYTTHLLDPWACNKYDRFRLPSIPSIPSLSGLLSRSDKGIFNVIQYCSLSIHYNDSPCLGALIDVALARTPIE